MLRLPEPERFRLPPQLLPWPRPQTSATTAGASALSGKKHPAAVTTSLKGLWGARHAPGCAGTYLVKNGFNLGLPSLAKPMIDGGQHAEGSGRCIRKHPLHIFQRTAVHSERIPPTI